ncbi:MAG: MBL fold metallo-hydrolase [Planctomycetaceae bacterium]|nr:MBL fold metallo-hydrolase [Planctomycetaceae bacterium]
MFLKQYYLGCLAHASYMIADKSTGVAAVVDPQRDIEQYLQDAREHGFEIKHVFLTHFHADFLAGHIELRDQLGATIYLGARAEAEYDFVPLKEGDRVEFGSVRLETLETPGHTPEGISLLVYDLEKSESEPHAVLTGDTLFIGDVGRPDLLASIGVTAVELSEMLYHSINKLKALPDSTLVYPAHGAGSLCGKNLSDETVSTIGEQKKYNYALQDMPEDEFARIVQVEQPDAPEYFVYDAIKNRQERENLEETMSKSMNALPLEEVLKRQAAGEQVADVRDGGDFDAGHLRGAVNIGLRGKYATWAGTVLNHSAPIVVIADEGAAAEAVMRLGRIGFDNVSGYLDGGMTALIDHPEHVESVERATAPAVQELLEQHELLVLDVRAERERETVGYINGSLNIPLNHLEERISEVPADQRIAVHCAGGYRSAIAVSLLQKHGITNVLDMVGGFQAWVKSGLPVTEHAAATAN